MAQLAQIAERTASWTIEDVILQHAVEQFLYHEAALLDDRRYHDWYELLADDLEYWMPVRMTRAKGDEDNEFAKLGQGAYFDDTKELLGERVRKLDTGYAWAEDPPSRTRRLLSNIRIVERLPADAYKVEVNFLIYRSRLARDEDLWAGRREDIVRSINGQWKIARRHIFLDQVSLGSKNLSIFF